MSRLITVWYLSYVRTVNAKMSMRGLARATCSKDINEGPGHLHFYDWFIDWYISGKISTYMYKHKKWTAHLWFTGRSSNIALSLMKLACEI